MRVAAWTWAAPVAAAIVVALVLWSDENGREQPDFSDEPVAVSVADMAMAIPANALRFVGQRRQGPHGRLDLALAWPDLVGRTSQSDDRFDAPGTSSDVIWVSILPKGEAMDAAERLATIYARLFVGEPFTGPEGLQGRRLSGKAGYEGEEIWFEPGAVHPFVARCYASVPGEPVSTCLHDEAIGPVIVTWRFRRGLLDVWPALTDAMRGRLASWGIRATP